MKLKRGDRIFYQNDGELCVDIVTDILSTEEGTLYEIQEDSYLCVSEEDVLDESDERVRNILSMEKDTTVKLSEIRNWLATHARSYYYSDSWSLFKSEEMIRDLCKAMIYGH